MIWDVEAVAITYKTIRDAIVLLQDRGRHLRMLMVVVLDEVCIRHSWLLLDQDGGFDNFAETDRTRIARLEHHFDRRRTTLEKVFGEYHGF